MRRGKPRYLPRLVANLIEEIEGKRPLLYLYTLAQHTALDLAKLTFSFDALQKNIYDYTN